MQLDTRNFQNASCTGISWHKVCFYTLQYLSKIHKKCTPVSYFFLTAKHIIFFQKYSLFMVQKLLGWWWTCANLSRSNLDRLLELVYSRACSLSDGLSLPQNEQNTFYLPVTNFKFLHIHVGKVHTICMCVVTAESAWKPHPLPLAPQIREIYSCFTVWTSLSDFELWESIFFQSMNLHPAFELPLPSIKAFFLVYASDCQSVLVTYYNATII